MIIENMSMLKNPQLTKDVCWWIYGN